MYTSLERRTANCAHTRTRQLEAQAAIVGAHEPADLLLQHVEWFSGRLQCTATARSSEGGHAWKRATMSVPDGPLAAVRLESDIYASSETRQMKTSNLDCESTGN